MVFFIVILLMLAIMEFGLYWRSDVALSQASRDGARTGAAAGRSANADMLVLSSIRDNLDDFGDGIDVVVIFNAPTPDALVPAGCLLASIPTVCNRYSGAGLEAMDDATITSTFGLGSGAWDPTTRCDRFTLGGGGGAGTRPDFLGVFVQTNYVTASGTPPLDLLDGPQNATIVVQIEPQNTAGVCT